MAAGQYFKNFTHGTLQLTDGSAVPLVRVCDMDKGTISITNVAPGLREVVDYERKGQYCSSAFTTRKYPILSVTFNYARWKDTANGTITDLIMATTGTPYSGRTSTIAPTGATVEVPLALDAQITIEGTDFGDSADHVGGALDWRIDEYTFTEGDPNEVTLTGPVLGALTDDFAQAVA